MSINITFRHMEHTPALDQLIREKSEKFSKWVGTNAEIHWICWVEGVSQCAEVKVHRGQQEYFAKASSDDLYKTIDLVIQKVQNQIR